MTDPRTLIAIAVQHLLAEKGMNQTELAARIDAEPSALSARLSGAVALENRDIVRIAGGLDVSPGELVERARALGEKSTQAAVAAAVGTFGPLGKPKHDATFFQGLIDEAQSTEPGAGGRST